MVDFGKINTGLSVGALQSIRVNAGGTAFEAYTPGGSGITIGDAVTGGGANRVLYEDGSQNLAATANFTYAGEQMKLGKAGAGSVSPLFLNHPDSFNIGAETQIDFGQVSLTVGRIANYYDSGSDWGLKFYTYSASLNSTAALILKGDNSAVFGGSVSFTNPLTVTTTSGIPFTAFDNTSGTGSRAVAVLRRDGSFGSNEEQRLDWKTGALVIGRDAIYYDSGSDWGRKFYTYSGGLNSAPVLTLKANQAIRHSYDASNYYETTVSSAGAVSFDAVGASAGFEFLDKLSVKNTGTPQFTAKYDDSKFFDITVNSSGQTTLAATGTGTPKVIVTGPLETQDNLTWSGLGLGGSLRVEHDSSHKTSLGPVSGSNITNFRGWFKVSGNPTTTQFPTTGDWGFHKDTGGGTNYICINDGGTIHAVTMSTI